MGMAAPEWEWVVEGGKLGGHRVSHLVWIVVVGHGMLEHTCGEISCSEG